MNQKNIRAFSLTELLIAISIFVIAIGAIYGVMLVGNNAWKTYENRIAAQREARKAIARMVRDFREASVITPAGGNTFYTVDLTRGGTDITYEWSSSGAAAHTLRRTVDTDETIIAQNISSLSVSQDSSSVTVTVTATKESAGGQTISATMSGKIAKRI